MQSKKIGTLAGAISVLGWAVQVVPGVLLARWTSNRFESELPVMFGTVGQTVTGYSILFEVLGPLVTVTLALGLGYYVGRQHDVVREYRALVEAVALGSTGGVVALVTVLFLAQGSFAGIDAMTVVFALGYVARWIVSVALVVTVSAFAGAALAHVRAAESEPGNPTDAEIARSGPPDSDSKSKSSEKHSRPAR